MRPTPRRQTWPCRHVVPVSVQIGPSWISLTCWNEFSHRRPPVPDAAAPGAADSSGTFVSAHHPHAPGNPDVQTRIAGLRVALAEDGCRHPGIVRDYLGRTGRLAGNRWRLLCTVATGASLGGAALMFLNDWKTQ